MTGRELFEEWCRRMDVTVKSRAEVLAKAGRADNSEYARGVQDSMETLQTIMAELN